MIAYLVGYYWYKNFWDELLLFWVLKEIESHKKYNEIIVLAQDEAFLQGWLEQNSDLLYKLRITSKITCASKIGPKWEDMLYIWWWEVLSDERSFPYNWWTYIVKYRRNFISWNVGFLWWVGTEKKRGTSLLYTLTLWRAKRVITRDPNSYSIACTYSSKSKLARDFAFDVLDVLDVKNSHEDWEYVIINLNKHIYSKEVLLQCIDFYMEEKSKWRRVFFLPASVGSDDADSELYSELKNSMPELKYMDRTSKSLLSFIEFIKWAEMVYATRLHILLPVLYYCVPYKIFVYQEKITRLIEYIDKVKAN